MISIIIPAFNEEKCIGNTIRHLFNSAGTHNDAVSIHEIIVADGGSSDGTIREAEAAGARVVRCGGKGRAVQMNEAAAEATAPVLYFLHADTIPPDRFMSSIKRCLDHGYDSGCPQIPG